MPEQKQILDLIVRAEKGESDAFDTLFNTYDKRVYYFCRMLTANDADAAEVTRDAFVYAKRNLREIPEGQTFLRWICGNAFYLAKIRMASSRGESVVVEEADGNEFRYDELQDLPRTAEEPTVRKSDLDTVNAFIDTLSDSRRFCLMIHDFVGFSVAETAALLGCDADAVKAHTVGGRLAIAERLNDDADGLGTQLLPFLPRLLKTCGKTFPVPEDVSLQTRAAYNIEDEDDPFDKPVDDDWCDTAPGASGTTQKVLWIVAALVLIGAAVFLVWWFGKGPVKPAPAESSAASEPVSEQSEPVSEQSAVASEDSGIDLSGSDESSEESTVSEPAESSEPIESSEPAASSEPTESSVSPVEDTYPRAKENLNLRDAPGTEGKKLAVIPGGRHVTILETVTNDKGEKWYKVSFVDDAGKTQVGYCSAEYVELQ